MSQTGMGEIEGGASGTGQYHQPQPETRGGSSGFWWFLAGIMAAFLLMAVIGKLERAKEAASKTEQADVAELRLKVSALTESDNQSKREMAETRQVVVGAVQRLESLTAGHNTLVRDLQGAFVQNDRRMFLMDRVLQDKYGKSKWADMVKSADTSLAQEAAEAMKAQMKAKEEAEAKAKKEAAKAESKN